MTSGADGAFTFEMLTAAMDAACRYGGPREPPPLIMKRDHEEAYRYICRVQAGIDPMVGMRLMDCDGIQRTAIRYEPPISPLEYISAARHRLTDAERKEWERALEEAAEGAREREIW